MVITGTHPREGLLTYQEVCAFSGDGLLLRHGPAPYVRREGEQTAAERNASLAAWPAAGSVDTEIGCFMKPEVAYAAKTIWA